MPINIIPINQSKPTLKNILIRNKPLLVLLPGVLVLCILGPSYGSFFLLGLGALYLGYHYLHKRAKSTPFWKRLKLAYLLFLVLFFSSFLLIESMIISAWHLQGSTLDKVDYIIILGAGLKKDTVSNRLRVRLDKGLVYTRQYKNAKVILSGGKGADELISEAAAMRNYLLAQGFPDNRLILEDQSTSTVENLKFSKKLISSSAQVLIVTSDYHLYRSLMIANRLGYNATGASAASPLGIRLNYSIREYLAMSKDILFK